MYLNKNSKINVYTILKYLILFIFLTLSLYPFVWILINSFKNNAQIFDNSFALPKIFMYQNYTYVWSNAKIGLFLYNSLFISILAVSFSLIVSSMVSYVLSRIKWNFLLYTYFILGIMIPIHAVLIPLFIIVRNLNLLNTRLGLIIVYCAGSISLSIFILVGFMKTLPKELEESAFIDGCSYFRIFLSIILPLAKPALATVATLIFINNWNDYLFSKIMISNPVFKTLTVGIADLRGQYYTEYGLMCAGLVITILPVVLIYTLFQEQVIKGMTAGAVKG